MAVSRHTVVAACVCLALLQLVTADLYMHQPRGSNNRLNERSANRDNGNRLFDSQNNNRGGYNKGDNTLRGFANYDEQYHMSYFMSDESGNHKSIMHVEWTNQHGCGGNEHGDPSELNCAIILQYMCLPEMIERNGATTILDVEEMRTDCTMECHWPVSGNLECDQDVQPRCPPMDIRTKDRCEAAGGKWRTALINDEFNCLSAVGGATWPSASWGTGGWGGWAGAGSNSQDWSRLRDGLNTNRQEFSEPANANDVTPAGRFARYNRDVDPMRGLHENWEHYDECYRRERNRGLFTADQNLANNRLGYSSAIFTRQNPNNNRRGYECPEERDYYPYWHPSPWRDIAVMTDRLDHCEFFRQESQNVKGKGLCRNTATCNNCVKYNQMATCESNGGRWVEYPAHGLPPPDCIQAAWSRVNHHGNGRHGQMNSYNWTIPYLGLPDGQSVSNQTFRCVVRLRYNISTDDYDYTRVNASFNQNDGQGVESPVRQNPNVNIGAANQALQLAINTAQFGRTFQDRSHTFRLLTRPKYSSPTAFTASIMNRRPRNQGQLPYFFDNCATLWNLNVRGKRGNIVQTYPAVEYDFSPNDLTITDGDCLHVQWTGSNTHNNGDPAGDGQAGDAGEGTGGTDRHNWVELETANFAASYPQPWENNTLFTFLKDAFSALPVQQAPARERPTSRDIRCQNGDWEVAKRNWALRMATAGYYNSFDCPSDELSIEQRNEQLNNLLNNAFPSYEGGIFQFRYGTYSYMCTRNHNFSNRDQKGILRVLRATGSND